MINITFPDGSIRQFKSSINSLNIAKLLSLNLAKITVAAYVDNTLKDAKDKIINNCKLKLVTIKDNDGLRILRYSCAYILANAIKELYPDAKIITSKVIDNEFYYDFYFQDNQINKDNLFIIENKMKELIKKSMSIEYKIVSRDEAISFFKNQKETYKVKIINDFNNKFIKLYTHINFTDLSRGPHIPNTSLLKAFKIIKIITFRDQDSCSNKILTRIYGTCWGNKKDLNQYLNIVNKAEKRDHRKIGRILDLFHFQDDCLGIAFWHNNGMIIWRNVEDYMRISNNKYGYDEIKTPIIANFNLWEKSGHASRYTENIFITKYNNKNFVIRPMNCPSCIQVYNKKIHSYKDLPLRIAEFGIVHRNESSGSLHGLLRAKSFTQDDGHIFCLIDQVEEEIILILNQCFEVYKDFGFNNFNIKIAFRPEKRIGDDNIWDKSEKLLTNILDKNNIRYEILKQDGAFYGPKIEFHLKDIIGRNWQCGTIQLDFLIPKRLDAMYVDKYGKKQVPIMIHRAIVGSLERFIGMLIEHYSGHLPLWLAPVQLVIIGISNNEDDYCKKLFDIFKRNNIRVKLDLRNEKIGFKIREHTILCIPYFIIVGKNEKQNNIISVRKHNGKNLRQMSIDNFCIILNKEIKAKK